MIFENCLQILTESGVSMVSSAEKEIVRDMKAGCGAAIAATASAAAAAAAAVE